MNLSDIPRTLNRQNIDIAIKNYCDLLEDIPLKIESDNILNLLITLKRSAINSGPYPNVAIFESANRIMTDLTILYGIKSLFSGSVPEIEYEEFKVEFGHDNFSDFDITASNNEKKLVGEAFNVAEQFFQPKKTKMLQKLRKIKHPDTQILLMYNSDAVHNDYNPKPATNEFHLKVQIEFWK